MTLVYVSPLIFSALLGLILAIYIALNRPAPGSRALVGLFLGTSLWSAGYALEFLIPSLEAKLFWAKFQYFGITTIPLAWFYFATQHLGMPEWLRRWLRHPVLLWVIPAITLLLVWSNELHDLIWQDVSLISIVPLQMLEIHHGPWFWVYWVYAYILMLLGSFILVRGFLGSVRMHRWQIILAIFASLFPWIGNLLYIGGVRPFELLDLTPFAFTISALLFTISLFRFQLVQILPIAQRTVFAGMTDGVLVLDMQDHVVDMNPAARKLIPYAGDPLGKPIAQVMPELAQWLAQRIFEGEYREEVSYGEGSDQRIYDLRITPLLGISTRPVGRLIVGHDITEHKEQEAHLESVVTEHTEALRETVEQLQRELTQRTLAERRFEEVVESAPDAMFLVDSSGAIRLANAQAERLFGYAREELLGKNIEMLVPSYRRRQHQKHIKEYTADPRIRQISFELDLSAQRKDGSEFPVEISLGPLATAQGVWVACNVRDISARKQAEQEQKQLIGQIQQSREQLIALTHRLQEVQEFERRQIATELHDRVGQNLTGLNLNLRIIEDQMNPSASPALLSRLEDSQQLLEETTRQVRDVMADLRPPMLDEYGLVSTLHWYCGIFTRRTGIAVRVIGEELKPRLQPQEETVLFRIVQEALNNVIRHANAHEVLIILESAAEAACLIVKDNGRGFKMGTGDIPSGKPHWGLINIEQRAASIGGQLAIDSAPGKGTKLTITLRRTHDED